MTAADTVLIALGFLAWGVLFFRYYRVADHVERYEGVILRPLSISIDLLGLHYLLNKSWWPAAVALFWGLFWISGVAEGTLRPGRSLRELANPPKPVSGGELPILSHDDSWRIGKSVWKVSFLSFIPELLLFLHQGLRWYMAAIASVASSFAIGPVLAMLCFATAARTLRKKQGPVSPKS